MKVPDLYVGKKLVVGEGYPIALGQGPTEVRGSSYIEGPLLLGNVTNIPTAPASLVVASHSNSDVKIPSFWAAYFQGSVRISGTIIADTVAATKSKPFVIDHPTKKHKKLVHVALEGPENGVYVRGKLQNSNIIELPEYWLNLVDEETITIQLQPINTDQRLIVKSIENNKIYIENTLSSQVFCFYHIYGTRKDIEKLKVEVDFEDYGL
jgi:hypothetical protein